MSGTDPGPSSSDTSEAPGPEAVSQAAPDGGPGTPVDRGRFARPHEVAAALHQLTDGDYDRLLAWARIFVPGTGYSSDADLLNQAIDSVGRAANARMAGARDGRAWRIHVVFMAHLFKTIQGTASDARRAKSRKNISLDESLHEEAHLDDPLAVLLAEESVEVVAELLRDVEIRAILEGQADGLTGPQIQQRSGMSQQQYENAQHRLRRRRRAMGGV